jgi:putative phosphoesterase
METLPPQIAEAFQGVDLILHAGDICNSSALDELECVAPVLAAEGDDDCGPTLTDKRLKPKHVLKIQGLTLWLVHKNPYRYLFNLQQAKGSPAHEPDAPDIVVFGHTHYTVEQCKNGILFVNPGSPMIMNYGTKLGTVALLQIENGKAEAKTLHLSQFVELEPERL